MIPFALYTVFLVFCSVMSARAYYLRRIQVLEEEAALRRLLSNDGPQRPQPTGYSSRITL